MANPTITPWAPAATFTVANSTFAAVDVRLADIDAAPATITLTIPAGATVVAYRDPANWSGAGAQLLGGGAWIGAPIVVDGQWTIGVTPGGAATDPATLQISDEDGSNPTGILRLVVRDLAGNAVFEPGGGTLSIDRVVAHPTITNLQVSSGLPIVELDNVTLTSSVQPTVSVNPAPAIPLGALPPIVSQWTTEPANTVAVLGFPQAGTGASFAAPAAYAATNLSFRLTGGYNLDGAGLASAANPRNSDVLQLTVDPAALGICFVIDRSGSMSATDVGGNSRWSSAVVAAHACLDVLRVFRPGSEHKAGIVTFESSKGWKQSAAAGEITLRNPANGAVGSTGTLNSFGDLAELKLGSPMTMTPIGDALVTGFEAVSNALNTGGSNKKGSVLLLTDGYENSGHVTIAAAVGSATQTFGTWKGTSSADELVGDRLFVVAVGQQVDQDRLNALAGPESIYNMTQSLNDILPLFIEILSPLINAEPLMPVGTITEQIPPSNPLYFPMATGDQKAAFLVPWTSENDTLELAWRAQGNTGAFTVVDPAGAGVKLIRRKTHGLIVADVFAVTGSTAASEWRLRHMHLGNAVAMTNNDVVGIADLMLRSKVAFDQPEYFIGDTIDLSCRIRHGGNAVENATIELDVARPGEGLGTFLATHSGRYKALARDLPGDFAGSPDQLSGKGLMHAVLLHVAGLEELPRVEIAGLSLTEGTPGDYATGFTDTAKEGTYIFRYRIEGTLPDGSRYSRVMVRSTWVGVRPDPSLLGTIWTQLQNPPGYTMTFTPKATSGELLGPFRTDVIDMKVIDGTFDGGLIDNLDGSYTRTVRTVNDRSPVVTMDIYSTPMNPAGPSIDSPGLAGMSCTRLLLATLRCFLCRLAKLFGLGR